MLILRRGNGGSENGHARQASDDQMPRQTYDVVSQRRAGDDLHDDETESHSRNPCRPLARRTAALGQARSTDVRHRKARQRGDGGVRCRAKWRERAISEPPERRSCRHEQQTPPAHLVFRMSELSDRDERHGRAADHVRHHQNRRHAAEHMWRANQARHQSAGQDQHQPEGDGPRAPEFLMT